MNSEHLGQKRICSESKGNRAWEENRSVQKEQERVKEGEVC